MEKNKTNSSAIEVSVIIPCLNEEKTLSLVIKKVWTVFENLSIKGEVIVVDNGSTDESVLVAKKEGARVINCPYKGYGYALRWGFSNAQGLYVIMGDADDSYNFLEIKEFVDYLRKGYDLVIGSRLRGKIEKGAMPFLNRYIGTPVLSSILNFLFKTKISDCNCGLRGISQGALRKMNLKSGGMELASEMIIKAGILGLKIKEIPINFYKDKRQRKPHLRRWHDGWRHLKFMLLYAPNFVFIFPSLFFFFVGSVLVFLQVKGPFSWGPVFMDIHFMIFGLTLAIMGFFVFQMGIIIKLYSHLHYYFKDDLMVKMIKRFNFEKEILTGFLVFLTGFLVDLYLLLKWITNNFHGIFMPRVAVFGFYFIFLGISLIFFAFIKAIMQEENN